MQARILGHTTPSGNDAIVLPGWTLNAGNVGGGGSTNGLPVIQNLRREIVSFQSVIRWNVVAEYEPGAFGFRLWFGLASPVDTSGPPDQIVAYISCQWERQAARAQTEPEYVAVAAYTPIEQGTASELFLEWGTVAPISPLNQYASRKQANYSRLQGP